MIAFLKGFLRLVADIILFVGPLLSVVMIVAGASGKLGFADRFTEAGAGIAMGLYCLFWSLLIGSVLRLLLSIDDRLQSLQGKP